MKRQLAAVCGFLTEAHRREIAQAAEACGFAASFYGSNEEALPHLAETEVIYAAATGGGHKLAQAAPKLKWFCSISAGVDALLKDGVLPAGCQVSNSAGAYGVTIAEHLVMMTIMLLRRYPEYDDKVRRKEWASNLPIRSILGSRITIAGTGDIGTRYAERLRPFQPAKITGVNRRGRKPSDVYDEIVTQDELDRVLPETDVLVLCLPGTAETKHILSKERIAKLPETSFVINVGRGSAVDEDALAEALNGGRLAGAALDVFATEPLPPDSPLWTTKNLVITPHCSGKMTLAYTRDRSVSMFCEDLANFVADKPLLRAVDVKLGY